MGTDCWFFSCAQEAYRKPRLGAGGHRIRDPNPHSPELSFLPMLSTCSQGLLNGVIRKIE